jgi:Protein of unknown function (DUF1559)
MHNYADVHGSLPPAAIYSADGKPLLSWRVALLPYIEQKQLYDQFHLDEPWDSPHNLSLLSQMPTIFEHFHGRATREPHTTYYRVFVGAGAAFEGPAGVSLKDFKDGMSSTFLIVEAGDAAPWTKPDELPYDPKGPLPALGGYFSEGFVAALADGSVRTVSTKTPEDVIRAAITRSGGETVSLP